MRTPTNYRRTPVGANMTPMIDVVFLLIIFFLVSSHLAKQEIHLPLDLPEATTALVDDFDVAPLTIHVDQFAKWQVGSRVVDVESLKSLLTQYASDSAQPSVRIRSDRSVLYSQIEPILREVAICGITDVRIAVYAGDPEP